jgi:MGT family glycosyltransferase
LLLVSVRRGSPLHPNDERLRARSTVAHAQRLGCSATVAEAESKTVVFFPEGAFGPTNNCVGIGEVLRRHGHRVIFVIEESFAGTLEEKGFEERLMRLAPPPEVEEEPGQFWKDFIRETAPVFRKSTFDQLGEFIAPTWQALLDGARYVDERLVEIFEEVQPDAVVEDNVCAFPAIPASGRPWVRIVSCNPLELKDPDLPPPFSGLPIDDRSAWAEYRDEYRRVTDEMQAGFSEFCLERGAPALPDGEMIHESPWLNLYLYPSEVDYPRSRLLGPAWHNLGSSVRTTDSEWQLPPEMAERDGSLIYVSLGSLGSGDVPLMESLVEALAETPHRYVVSKGPQHAEYELADNMVGEEFLPQVSVLPQVDLVITHGGNNTTTECLHFGKPMVLLPIFWDQHDNAQRIDETGFGVRLPTYSFGDGDLPEAIDRLLADSGLRARLATGAERLQASPGTERAAKLIERVAATAEPATSR